jgi:hypothetical protein
VRNGCASEFGDNLRLNAETVFLDPPYETLICASEANVVLQLFLHDYDNDKIFSFCRGTPMMVMNLQDIWGDNRKAIANYAPSDKDLAEANPGNRRPRNRKHNQNVPIAPSSWKRGTTFGFLRRWSKDVLRAKYQ